MNKRSLTSITAILLFVLFDRSLAREGNILRYLAAWPLFLVQKISEIAQIKEDFTILLSIVVGIPLVFLYWFGVLRLLLGPWSAKDETGALWGR